jgi:hypothetical protein
MKINESICALSDIEEEDILDLDRSIKKYRFLDFIIKIFVTSTFIISALVTTYLLVWSVIKWT